MFLFWIKSPNTILILIRSELNATNRHSVINHISASLSSTTPPDNMKLKSLQRSAVPCHANDNSVSPLLPHIF